MALGQNIALVMVNKFVKFHEDILNNKKVMTKVKVCHANAYTNANTNADDDTRVMTIPRHFFQKQSS